MTMDDRWEQAMREMAEGYNRPSETPREEMWAAIQEERRERAAKRVQAAGLLRIHPALRWGLGVAAVLAIGIGIGRFSQVPVATNELPIAEGGAGEATAYRWAAAQHLDQVETFLALFQQDTRVERVEYVPDLSARDLLSTTRLLLDSPASEDAAVRALLEDIELVLVQIAQFLEQREDEELDLIDDSLRRRGVMLRLQTVVANTDGAL